MEIKSTITINASPSQVWDTLMDFESYPDWNPFVKEISGKAKVGEQIKVILPGMKFDPVILVLDENKEFRWLGKLLFKGLFDGEHYFILKEQADRKTELVHGEKFKGLLVPLLKKKLQGETLEGFRAMNQGLKEKVES